jgi:protein required for attachment to host cells
MASWVVVADATRARIFEVQRRRHLELLLELSHPAGRAHGRALETDRPGRVQQRATGSIRSAIEPQTEVHQVELARFAREIGQALRAGLDRAAYDQLVLIAPPHFLGVLRSQLDGQVARRVTTSVDKDLTAWTERDLAESIGEQL